MSVASFKDLLAHYGHEIVIAKYADNDHVCNVAIECEDCNEVLLDFDNDEFEDKDG